MKAKVMSGRKLTAAIREDVKAEVEEWRARGINPRLSVVLVGEDPASVYYAEAKQRLSKRLGVEYDWHRLPETATEAEVLALLDNLNKDDAVHGIMVELPLPKGLSKEKILESVHPLKDVDGVNPLNQGYLALELDGLFPATPMACMEMLDHFEIPVTGQEAVIVGWGATVGKPLLNLMLGRRATVTTTHSRTKDLAAHTRKADIIVAAVGRPGMITADMVKPGAVVIDVAMNETADGMVGDVDYEAVGEVAGYITPVPGGVGSVTTVLLFKNLLKGMRLNSK